MKNIAKYLLAAVMAFVAVACVEEKIEERPVINLSATSVTIPSDGRSQKIVYEVSGVSEVAPVSVSADAQWLTVNATKARLIEVSATKNETGAARTADFTVSYPGADDVVVEVTQPSWQEPITLTVHGTESTAIIFSVVTESDDVAWVG